VDEILFRAKVPFSRLDARVAQEQLDLFEFATGAAVTVDPAG
jgi:hypothetical protein